MKRALIIVLALAAAALGALLLFRSAPPPTEAERNRAFAQSMSGVTLTGRSTRLHSETVHGPERYRIDSVTHLSGDTWLFRTRLQYDGHDIPVPIPLTVKWAGDTPVITMTALTIPGAGTFTARVVLYQNQYAGTWSGEKHGGQLFGTIERAATSASERTPDTTSSTSPPSDPKR